AGVFQRLRRLPPFWLAFLLIFTLSFSQAFLGLPIAVAGVGAPAGLGFVLVLGAINLLTIACMAEAVSRSGTVRYKNGFIGSLVSDTLGRPGASLLSGAAIARFCLGLLAACIGLALTLSELTRVSSMIWIGVLFPLVLYVLSRPRLHFAVNVIVLLGL